MSSSCIPGQHLLFGLQPRTYLYWLGCDYMKPSHVEMNWSSEAGVACSARRPSPEDKIEMLSFTCYNWIFPMESSLQHAKQVLQHAATIPSQREVHSGMCARTPLNMYKSVHLREGGFSQSWLGHFNIRGQISHLNGTVVAILFYLFVYILPL